MTTAVVDNPNEFEWFDSYFELLSLNGMNMESAPLESVKKENEQIYNLREVEEKS